MNMFKEFAQVLLNIPMKQRLLGLVIIVLAFVGMELGLSLIKTKNPETEEMKKTISTLRIELQFTRESVVEAQSQLSKLNTRIIESEMGCTNKIMSREQEIWKMIDSVQRIMKTHNNRQLQTIEKVTTSYYDPNDTGVVVSAMVLPPKTKKVIVKDNTEAIEAMDLIKKKIKKSK